jgi:hypothetical protein
MAFREAQLTVAVNGRGAPHFMQAWFDFDCPGAWLRAQALVKALPDFAGVAHRLRPQSVHVLGLESIEHAGHHVLAEEHGADAAAVRKWRDRGYPSLRVSRRPYDDARGAVVAWGAPSQWQAAEPAAVAPVLLYLAHWRGLAFAGRLVVNLGLPVDALLKARVSMDAYVQPKKKPRPMPAPEEPHEEGICMAEDKNERPHAGPCTAPLKVGA